MSINRGKNKEDVVNTYNGILLSCKKKIKIVPFAEMWMDLEIVIQSKSEIEKPVLYINTYMWNLEKWYR